MRRQQRQLIEHDRPARMRPARSIPETNASIPSRFVWLEIEPGHRPSCWQRAPPSEGSSMDVLAGKLAGEFCPSP
jgi:hypothetical protein